MEERGEERRRVSASAGLAFGMCDSSASCESGRDPCSQVAKEAFDEFVKGVAGKNDRVTVFTFNHECEFALSAPARQVRLNAPNLTARFMPNGGTDLPSAMRGALDAMRKHNDVTKARHKGKVVQWLIVFTDGDAGSRRMTEEQAAAMLRQASADVWNLKVCFIAIGQGADDERRLHAMAGAVAPRLRTEGGMVKSVRGCDAASLRGVFREASTHIRKVQASIRVESEGRAVEVRGKRAEATIAALGGHLEQTLRLGGGSTGGGRALPAPAGGKQKSGGMGKRKGVGSSVRISDC